jgi:AcrR family transcriptional regulator
VGVDTADPWAAVTPETSRRMVLGAVDAFAERGYHATTTRDIASRAGLSPAALYVHYPSKAALLAHISLLGHEAALALVQDALDRGGHDPVARLRAAVSDFVAWHARHHRVARVVQYELAALPDDVRGTVVALRRKTEALVSGEISAGVGAGVMAVEEPRRVARALLSLAIDVARWYDPGGRDTPEALGTLYADLAARMVGAPESPLRRAPRRPTQ